MNTRPRNISDDLLTTPGCSSQPETSENLLPVPFDLVLEIFSRMTLKSVARCRCVSKLWASILRRPHFKKLFLRRSSSRPKLLFACEKDRDFFIFSADQPQNVNEKSSPVVVNHHMKFSLDERYGIIGLVHGFLVLYKDGFLMGKQESVSVICNASTRQVLTLPVVKTRSAEVRSMVGYDPIDKHFKVLSITGVSDEPGNVVAEMADEHQVMTLGTENPSWRRIECPRLPYYPHNQICIDGILYYLSISCVTKSFFIVYFVVKSEKFSYIEVNEALGFAAADSMINYNGKLGVNQHVGSSSTSLKFWVLEDLEKQEWCEYEYLLPALWKDFAAENYFFRCVGVTRENEIVLLSSFYLIYFNHKRNTMVRVDIQGIDESKFTIYHVFLHHVEDVEDVKLM